MSLLSILFGRQKLAKPKFDALFALTTAGISLQEKLSLLPAGSAGVCFRPVESSLFDAAQHEVDGLMRVSAQSADTHSRTWVDEYGFRWIILEDLDFEDLVAGVHLVGQAMAEHGFGEQLLAAVFRFNEAEGRAAYWVYNYKRGRFYPFVPGTGEGQRDNAAEIRLQSVMERELAVEPHLEQWYALWGIPF